MALLNERDTNHGWAVAQASRLPPVWKTCEAVLSEAFHLLGTSGMFALVELLQERAIVCEFEVAAHIDDVLRLMKKYSTVPMAFADACLVRMTEILSDPTLLTTDSDFRVYRRHSRQMIPCVFPG
jgi:predicted nucleic acid-binding protein